MVFLFFFQTQYSVYQYQYEEDDAYAADDFFQGTTDEDFALQTRFKRLIGDVDSWVKHNDFMTRKHFPLYFPIY